MIKNAPNCLPVQGSGKNLLLNSFIFLNCILFIRLLN